MLTAAFGWLRFYQFAEHPVGIDETFTALYAGQQWGDLWSFVAENDIHPPFYFAYTRFFGFLGSDAFALRFGTVLAGVAALPVLFVAGWQFGAAGGQKTDRLTGILAMMLGGLATSHIAWSQFARAYSMMFLAFALATAGIAWLLRQRDATCQPFWRRGGRAAVPALVAVAVGMLLLLWSHNTGALYALAVAATLLVLWLTVLRASPGAFVNLAVLAVLVFLGSWPHLQSLLSHWQSVSSDYWIQAPTPAGLVAVFLETLGDAWHIRELRPAELAYAALLFGLAGWALVRLVGARDWPRLLLALGLVGGAAALLVGITYLARPILITRTATPLVAPWLVLVASGLAALRGPALRMGVLAACVLTGGLGAWAYLASPKDEEPWRRIVATITANSAGRPLVITAPNSPGVAISYHIGQAAAGIDVAPLPGPFPTFSEDGRYPTGWPGVPAITKASLDAVDTRIAAATGDVWLLLRGYWIYDPDALLRAHFDRSYCYQPLYMPDNDGLFLLKLVPRDAAAAASCTTYPPHGYYPYNKPDAGLIKLEARP